MRMSACRPASLTSARMSGCAEVSSSWARIAAAIAAVVAAASKNEFGGVGGFAAIRELTQQYPAVKILVVTMFEDDDSVFAAMRAGARGYVLKDMDSDDFARAIVSVGRGEALFSRGIATRMIHYFAQHPPSAEPFPELTDSERGVLRMMATGSNNSAIARDLSLSPKTVRNYISNIFRKLQVADRSQAIVLARGAGIEGP